MKKITALMAIFLISLGSYAQDEVNTSFASQMNTIFGQLDKTKIPNGILLDYGMEFTNVPAYNGTLTDSTYSTATSIKQIYKTLLSSRITATTPVMVTPTVFDSNWNSNRTEGVISLSGLFYKYSRIIQNATTTNKITYIGGKFYDKRINNVWQNPYEVLQTFAMSPAIEQYDQLSFQVKLPAALFYSNQTSTISAIAIDFDNGQGYQTITMGQIIPVSYTTTGMKNWKYKLNLTNGTVLYNQSKIQIGGDDGAIIDLPVPITPPCQTCRTAAATTSSGAKILYGENITATTAYLGGYGKVKITIDFAGDPNQGIKKPLIVAEGFDLGVILNPEKAYGSNTYSNTFRRSLFNSNSSALKNLIYDDYKQFDIIYVDWDNGVDYMQRNAYALEEVINWVNGQKALSGSTTQNVVLGQSMGGVIARYALADMEQRGLNHQTSLFISHDAPQQGANIPISLQYMYRHLTKQYMQTGYAPAGFIAISVLEDKVGVSNYLSILDAPASRQLLKNSINYDYSMNTSTSATFYDELKSKGLPNSGGYPTLCRNIALSNGSECGDTQNFQPGNDIVNFTYNKGLSFWGDLASMVYLPLGGAIGGTLLNPKLYSVGALGMFPGHSKFNVNFISRALYDSAGSEIYKGRISYTKKIAWLFNVTINLTDVSKNQPSEILPLDTYGGGYYDTKIIAGSVNVSGLYIRDRFSFIPTTSSLDIGKRNVVLDDADYKKSYVGAIPLQAPKNTPFANYITDFERNNPNSRNKNHISFNSRNGNWLASELNALVNPIATPQLANCSFICNGSQILGNDTVCSTSNYSVPNGADFYNWSIIEGGYLVNLNGSGANITLTNNNTGSGYVTILVTYGSAICGSNTITKRVWIGVPQIIGLTCPNESTICSGTFCKQELGLPSFDLTNNLEANVMGMTTSEMWEKTNWEWERINTNIVIAQNTQGNEIYVAPNYIGQTGVRVRAKNNCGWSEWYEFDFAVVSCGSNLMRSVEQEKVFVVYPNPSNDIVNVDVKEGISILAVDTKVSGELFDIMGNSKSKIKIKNKKASFSVNGLNKGVYVLKIYIDDKIESHQIAVK